MVVSALSNPRYTSPKAAAPLLETSGYGKPEIDRFENWWVRAFVTQHLARSPIEFQIVPLLRGAFLLLQAFMCEPAWRNMYLSAIVILSLATGVISLFPRFNHPTYQPLRAGVFSGMALSGIVPCLHKAAFLHPEPIAYFTTAAELAMGLVYIIGAVVYATKVPEKWLPGRFDIIGHSHQILHVLVVVGACIHYNTAWAYLNWREQSSCVPK